MTLRLALVIDGDPGGAKKALEETAAGIEKTGEAAERAGKKFEWLEPAGDGARKAAEPIKDIGSGLSEAAGAAPAAAGGVAEFGTAAEVAGGKLASLRGAVVGIGAGLAAGFGAAVVAEGLELAAGAAAKFFLEIFDSSPAAERNLKAHAELVERIKGLYGEARGAASSYGLESRELLTYQQQQNVRQLDGSFRSSLEEIDPGSGFIMTERLSRRLGAGAPFVDTVAKFREDLKDGLADVIAFRTQLASEAAGLAADSPFRALADQMLASTEEAAKLQGELQRSIDLYKGLAGNADAAATALGGNAEKFTLSGEAAAGALPMLREYDALLSQISSRRLPSLSVDVPSPPPAAPRNRGERAGGGYSGEFAAGGYTGDMDAGDVAGVVHGREFVINAKATAKHRPLLEAINAGLPGYAGGGFVGSGWTPAFDDSGGAAAGAAGGGGDWEGLFETAAKGVISALAAAAEADDWGVFWDRMLSTGLSILEGLISDWGQGVVDWASELGKQVANSLSDGGGLLGSLFGAPADPWAGLRGFAAGTESAPPGWAWAGEDGPELIHFGGGETVRNAAASRTMAGPPSAVVGDGRPASPAAQAWSSAGGLKVERHYHDKAGVEIREETRGDGSGGVREDVFIERKMAAGTARRGSAFQKAVESRYGLKPKTKRYG